MHYIYGVFFKCKTYFTSVMLVILLNDTVHSVNVAFIYCDELIFIYISIIHIFQDYKHNSNYWTSVCCMMDCTRRFEGIYVVLILI